MTPLEMIVEWRKGCTCAGPYYDRMLGKPPGTTQPEECHECTRALIESIEQSLRERKPMKPLTYWLKQAASDIAVVALFVAWKGYGSEGAGNILVTFLWLITPVAILAAIFGDRTWLGEDIDRPPGAKAHQSIYTMALFSALAYYGMPVLAVCCFIAACGVESLRSREPKAKERRSSR